MSSAPCWRAVAAATAVAAAAPIPPRKPARFRLDPEGGTHILLHAPATERVQIRTPPGSSPFVVPFVFILAALRSLLAACSPAFAQVIHGRPLSECQRLTSAVSLLEARDG